MLLNIINLYLNRIKLLINNHYNHNIYNIRQLRELLCLYSDRHSLAHRLFRLFYDLRSTTYTPNRVKMARAALPHRSLTMHYEDIKLSDPVDTLLVSLRISSARTVTKLRLLSVYYYPNQQYHKLPCVPR